MEPKLVSRDGGSCVLETIPNRQMEQLYVICKPCQYIASGFAYLFSTTFVLVFVALGLAASATVATILAGLFGLFN